MQDLMSSMWNISGVALNIQRLAIIRGMCMFVADWSSEIEILRTEISSRKSD